MMKPNPLSYLDIPKDWPKKGRLGEREIDLKEAWETLGYGALSAIIVDVPGRGSIAPWSNLGGLERFEVPEGTDGLLSREELESNGVFDATLEGWARDKHGIRLDLSADDVGTQAIRYDAYRRYVDETEW